MDVKPVVTLVILVKMGFRIQKRIKLGKNLGLNISKSGISPSYRTSRGTISSKGVSVRTGIKGVTYTKKFTGKSTSGCMLQFIFIAIIAICLYQFS